MSAAHDSPRSKNQMTRLREWCVVWFVTVCFVAGLLIVKGLDWLRGDEDCD